MKTFATALMMTMIATPAFALSPNECGDEYGMAMSMAQQAKEGQRRDRAHQMVEKAAMDDSRHSSKFWTRAHQYVEYIHDRKEFNPQGLSDIDIQIRANYDLCRK